MYIHVQFRRINGYMHLVLLLFCSTSDVEPDETTEISSQTSEQHILDKREQARRARDLIYTSSSEDEEEEEEKEELEKEEEEEEEEDEEDDEEEEDEDEEAEEDIDVDEDTAEDIPRELLEKELATKDKVEVVEEDKEEKKKKKEVSEPETPSKEDGNWSSYFNFMTFARATIAQTTPAKAKPYPNPNSIPNQTPSLSLCQWRY